MLIDFVKDFLEMLTVRIQPPEGSLHQIVVDDDEVKVIVQYGDGENEFTLENGDLENPDEIIEHIEEVLELR